MNADQIARLIGELKQYHDRLRDAISFLEMASRQATDLARKVETLTVVIEAQKP